MYDELYSTLEYEYFHRLNQLITYLCYWRSDIKQFLNISLWNNIIAFK